jgi:hypothetical protein
MKDRVLFMLQGTELCVHPCRTGWCPGPESRHHVGRPCPLYGERAGNGMATMWQTGAIRAYPYRKQIPGFDNSMILPVETRKGGGSE